MVNSISGSTGLTVFEEKRPPARGRRLGGRSI
jgi:hypothetical protein